MRPLIAFGPALAVLIGVYVVVQIGQDAASVEAAVLDPMALGLAFTMLMVVATLPVRLGARLYRPVAALDWIAPTVAAVVAAVGYWDIRLGGGVLYAVWGNWLSAGLMVLGLGVLVIGVPLLVVAIIARYR